MRDLRDLLDEAAGQVADLPDLASIRERGQSLRNRHRVMVGVAVAGVCALAISIGGAWLDGLDRERTLQPAQPRPDALVTDPQVRRTGCGPLAQPARGVIAYTQTRSDGTESVAVMAPDGGEQRCLVDTAGPDTFPIWSPDAQWLVFVGGNGRQNDLFKVRADGSELRQLTNSPANEVRPVWSPDGTRIAFTAEFGPGSVEEFHVMGSDGTQDRALLTMQEGGMWAQDWSPDGSTILYGADASTTGGHIALWAMAPDGSGRRLLRAEDGDFGSAATYSPDGKSLAFQADLDGGCIYRSDARAQSMVRLTTGCTQAGSISWSPDGTQLVVGGGDHGAADAVVLGFDGSNPHAITSGENVAYVDWQPATSL